MSAEQIAAIVGGIDYAFVGTAVAGVVAAVAVALVALKGGKMVLGAFR